MRHRVATKQLGRPTDQRLAILKSLVAGVLEHGYATTTETRAKQACPVIEKLITLAGNDNSANRKLARRWIPMGEAILTRRKFINVTGEEPGYQTIKKGPFQLKGADRRPSGERLLKRLFEELGPRFKDRPGGYLRLIRLGGESHINVKGRLTIRMARRGDSAKLIKIELVDL